MIINAYTHQLKDRDCQSVLRKHDNLKQRKRDCKERLVKTKLWCKVIIPIII